MTKMLLLAGALVGTLAFTPATLEPHPKIHAAIAALVDARAELNAAAHDFGGHKAAAIRAVDNALRQLRLADAYDNK